MNASTSHNTALSPTGLICELLEEPQRTRITTARPRFGWIVRDRSVNEGQSAYQILVASNAHALRERQQADLWDSGRVASAQSLHVRYAGRALESNKSYYWQAKTWNLRGNQSPWSEIQTFHTGTLRDEYATPIYPLEQHFIEPSEIVETSPSCFFVDFAKAAFATLDLTLTAGQTGEVDVHLGEVRSGTHSIDRAPDDYRRYRMVRLKVQAGTRVYRLAIPSVASNTQHKCIRMPQDVGEVMPFRYVELVGRCGSLRCDRVRQVAVTYRFNDRAAHFASASDVLNDVWHLCHHTIKATSFCGLFVDGDRERIPYEQDIYVHQLGHYACDREYTIARRTIEHIMTHPTWPTECVLTAPIIAWADYQYTGDASLLARYYELMSLRTLMSLARSEDGLLSIEQNPPSADLLRELHWPDDWTMRDMVDWPKGERDEHEMLPVNTVVNAFYHRALTTMSLVAGVLKHQGDAAVLSDRAARVRDAMHSRLIDQSRGLFVDGLGSVHASFHASMFPLAFGLVPEHILPTVLALINGKGLACSVYGAQFLLEGLYQSGQADQALTLLTSRSERSWAHMIYDVGSTMTTEAWDNRFKPNQDWNHAWATAPANIIARWLMGVRPLEAGFGRMIVHPQPGPLPWAEMTIPTIRGSVNVRFENDPGRHFRLQIDVPANTTARVVVPRIRNDDAIVHVDGEPRRTTASAQGLVIDNVGSGSHSFRV